MATKANNGNFYLDDVLVYDSYSATKYGVKVLKQVWIDEANEYRWILQKGKVKDNAFIPDLDGKSLSMETVSAVKNSYDLTWTKDVMSPLKGDILTGTDDDGTKIFLVFERSDRVHRLNKCLWSTQEQGHGSLEFYQKKLKGLKILKTSNGSYTSFSQL